MSVCSQFSLLNAQRYVLTGGPGVGKTTVIQALAKWGYQTVPEVYALLYERAAQAQMLGTFFADPVALYARILEEQIAFESTLDPKMPVFLDRSAIDIIAFAQYFKVPLSDAFCAKIEKQQYDLIFFLNPLPEYLYRQCAQRKETFGEAAYMHKLIKEVYVQSGYHERQLIDVPFGTIAERMQFIFDQI